MESKQLTYSASQISKTIPLQTVLIFPFVLQTLGIVGLIGYFSFKNGQQTVKDLSIQLRRGITNRIEEKLKTYTEIPHTINRLNAIAFANHSIDVDKAKGEDQFWQQNIMSPSTSVIYCGARSGAVFGIGKFKGKNSLQLWMSNATTQYIRHSYSLNSQGKRDQLLPKGAGQYDARTRPWYTAADHAGQSTWTAIYPDYITGIPTITASIPIYNSANHALLGVCATDLFLTQEMNQFLQSLEIGKSGQAFIMQRSGELVSTSFKESTSGNQPKPAQRSDANTNGDRNIQATKKYLFDHYGSFNQIQSSQLLDFKMDGKQQFVQVFPFQDPRGLDWLIVTVIPEADFMARIQSNTYLTVLLCIAALIVGVAISILTAHWITRPLVRISHSAKALARGEWDQTVEIERSGDLGELAASFNWMAHQLQANFTEERRQAEESLQRSEAKFRRLFEANLIGAIVADLDGTVIEANDAFLNIIGFTQDDVRAGKVNLVEITLSEYAQDDRQALKELKSNGVCSSYEKEFRNRDDSHVPVLIGYALLPENQQRVIGFVLDLTQQKASVLAERIQIEEALILEERNSIAREIHDTLAQFFTGIMMRLDTVKFVVAGNSKAENMINAIHELAGKGVKAAKDSVMQIRLLELEEKGLSHTLRLWVNETTVCTSLQSHCNIQSLPYPLPYDVAFNLLRIAQEATINTIKYANASTIFVELSFDSQVIRLSVQDNGDGFNPDYHHSRLSFGLVGMQERVQYLGGKVLINSQVGQGTEVIAIVPLPLLSSSKTVES
jgi:PAS domain S-box-containing protein